MEKNEIIEITSKASTDEREKLISLRGFHIGAIVLPVGALILMFLRGNAADGFVQDLVFLIALQMTSVALYQFIKLKNLLYLFVGVLGLGATILSLINVMAYYG